MKVYLAGSEAQISSKTYSYRPLPESNIFMSYFYNAATTKALDIFQSEQQGRTGWITIDSGAHTFFGFAGMSVVHNDNNKSGEMPDHHIYFENYVKWLKDNYYKFTYFVELDLQGLFGMDLIWAWRRRLRDEGLLDKCIMVHHNCNSEKDFQDLIKYSRSGYIGFEGKMGGVFKLDYKTLLKTTYQEGIKVHGFALTSQPVINKYPFFSVDSSSWLAAVRYAIIYKFKDGKMYQISNKKGHYMKHNISVNYHGKNRGVQDSFNKLRNNEVAFWKMQEYMTKLWKARGIDYGDRFLDKRKYEEFE